MRNYHELYLKTGVLIIAEVFEKFIGMCLTYHGLDPCHYFSSPEIGWDAMLKMIGLELELISDIDIYFFVENGMRGGISYITKRYSSGNKKYMKCFDNSQSSKYIMYSNAYNLYCWAMSQYLPYSKYTRLH